MTARRRLALFFALVILPIAAACAQLSSEDKANIARDEVRIKTCEYMTHVCKLKAGDAAAVKCWPVYDDCMTGAGLKDGGSHE